MKIDNRAVQTRVVPFTPEVRAVNDDGSIAVAGHAAVFNDLSSNLGGFVEMVAPGAFRKTLQEADVRLLFNHDPNLILARNVAETLRMEEDNIGLHIEADMAPTSYAQDLKILMERGDVNQMSFAFRVIKDDWTETDDGMPLRILREVKLYDASIVTYPAYPQTDVGLRAQQFDALMRSMGLSELPQDERDALIEKIATRSLSDSDREILDGARERLAVLARSADKAQMDDTDDERDGDDDSAEFTLTIYLDGEDVTSRVSEKVLGELVPNCDTPLDEGEPCDDCNCGRAEAEADDETEDTDGADDTEHDAVDSDADAETEETVDADDDDDETPEPADDERSANIARLRRDALLRKARLIDETIKRETV